MGFRVQIWSGGALWNPLSFLIKDSIQSNLWTGKESSLLKIQLVKNSFSLESLVGSLSNLLCHLSRAAIHGFCI